jgi:hypothetical protein
LVFVSSSSSSYPCLLNLPSFPLKNSKLDDRWSVKLRTANKRRRTGYLRRKLGGWLKRRRTGDERRRWNSGEKRRKNRREGLKRPKRSTRGRKS